MPSTPTQLNTPPPSEGTFIRRKDSVNSVDQHFATASDATGLGPSKSHASPASPNNPHYATNGGGGSAPCSPASPAHSGVGKVIDYIGFGRFHFFMLLIVGFAFGAEAMLVFLLTFVQDKVSKEFGMSEAAYAGATTFLFAGMLLGSLGFGYMSDHKGRRPTIILSFIVALVAGIGICAAPTADIFEAAFFVQGIGLGGGFIFVALFMELLPVKNRAMWTSIAYSLWSFGALAQCGLAYALRDSDWRWLAAVTITPIGIATLVAPLFPESPRFLLEQKRDPDAASRVLQRMAKWNGVRLPSEVLSDLKPRATAASPLYSVSSFTSGHWTDKYRQIFSKQMRRLTMSLFLIWGGVAVSYYGIIMLTTAVFLKNGAFGATAIAALGELPAYPLMTYCCKYLGRKLPLQMLPIMTTAFLFCFYAAHASNEANTPEQQKDQSSGAAISELVFAFLIRGCALMQFDIAYMYSPEAFPTSLRTTATGACSAVSRVLSMVSPFVAYPLQHASPIAPYFVFSFFLLMVALGAWQLPFDTSSRSMDAQHQHDDGSSSTLTTDEA